ncbi:putative protein of unknown function (DUF3421) [Lyophyllum shimeji]|uniref:Uncharacterized protein n=1 Tax=Lyophyllum shimeji TaxID=47721 RepID=A0A9P3PR29_LYOSH|nr:putative protein of unknown function (DUF3421) [Lyophyllum shimeji]
MSPRRKSIDSSSSSDESFKQKKDKKDKKDKEHKDKKDKDHKDKKDKDGKVKDKDKKDRAEHGKDQPRVEHTATGGLASEYYSRAQGQGQWSSPPFVPPSFEANRAAAPGFPSADIPGFPSVGTAGLPSASPGFPNTPHQQNRDTTQAAPDPPSGFRVPLTTTTPFPDPAVTGPPPCTDADGSPIFIGSALFDNSVHPCKIGRHLQPFVSVAYGGVEFAHHGRYDLLPFVPEKMEWVPTSYGGLPPGRRLVEGGYEDNGAKLYHALAIVNGVKVPGKTGEHLGACNVSFGGSEIPVVEYEILCWK